MVLISQAPTPTAKPCCPFGKPRLLFSHCRLKAYRHSQLMEAMGWERCPEPQPLTLEPRAPPEANKENEV